MATRQIRLVRRPASAVTEEDFTLVETYRIPLRASEVRVLTRVISLDPYLAIQLHGREVRGITLSPGDAICSRAVGEVAESRHPAFKVGDTVRGIGPWGDGAMSSWPREKNWRKSRPQAWRPNCS